MSKDDPLIFKGSKQRTLGLEWELQLVDQGTLNLADKVLPLMEAFPDIQWIQPEFIQSCIEISSKVCHGISELEAHVHAVLKDLCQRSKNLGVLLCGAGTHPICQRLALITPLPRYLRQQALYGYLARNQITFASHVHVGMPCGETAIALMREVKAYLPVLIAISSSSPFWRGYETGFACYRQRILASGRSFGIPPSFADWSRFCEFFSLSQRAGIFENIDDIHWDIRPRPALGTLEVRVMDSQTCLEDAISLAAFVVCLIEYLQSTSEKDRPAMLPKPLPWWLEKENYFQANRAGCEAQYIDKRGNILALKEIIECLWSELLPCASAMELLCYFEHLHQRIVSGVSWQRQLQCYKKTGNLHDVVMLLVDELWEGLG
ncbi:MAG: hypothetical protein AXA67_06900 [Methylothermaceae bacteria B42]|nr:MAG: hypothetical protein AXA67_06900 [Methylothermaceae bacteria B42]HHJ40248.1 YbdK family carboxylate-amine ligase [Methylothermaceae bacterium]